GRSTGSSRCGPAERRSSDIAAAVDPPERRPVNDKRFSRPTQTLRGARASEPDYAGSPATEADMRWFLGALSLLMVGVFDVGAAAAQDWIGGAPYRARIRVDANGETWVGIWVDAPDAAPAARTRAPMAVSLVI